MNDLLKEIILQKANLSKAAADLIKKECLKEKHTKT